MKKTNLRILNTNLFNTGINYYFNFVIVSNATDAELKNILRYKNITKNLKEYFDLNPIIIDIEENSISINCGDYRNLNTVYINSDIVNTLNKINVISEEISNQFEELKYETIQKCLCSILEK